jgi:uncharacterized membrane protein YdjX (TVP38/TMEM64 family)
VLFVIVALGIALIGGFFVRESIQVEWRAESVRVLVEQAGFWGPLFFLVMMTFRFAVLIPSPILLTASGICFGVIAGTIYGGLGLLLSALLKFAVAKLAGRESLIARLPESARRRLAVVNSGLGIGLLGAASSYPVGPAGLVHVGAILSGIRIVPFARPGRGRRLGDPGGDVQLLRERADGRRRARDRGGHPGRRHRRPAARPPVAQLALRPGRHASFVASPQ